MVFLDGKNSLKNILTFTSNDDHNKLRFEIILCIFNFISIGCLHVKKSLERESKIISKQKFIADRFKGFSPSLTLSNSSHKWLFIQHTLLLRLKKDEKP